MGCGSANNFIPVQMGTKQDKSYHCSGDAVSQNAYSSVDFSCQYRPEEVAIEFLEQTKYDPEKKLSYKQVRQMFLKEYLFLRPEDVDLTYNYLHYNRLHPNILKNENLESIEMSC